MLNFDSSFEQSCNRTFAELSTEIAEKDPDFLETYAEKLGLIGQSGWQGNVYQVLVSLSFIENTLEKSGMMNN